MKILFHTIIGFIALIFGYPLGGWVFILIMAPYLIYMVLRCDARFLPALILHCASESTATSIVFIGFILLSIIKYKELLRFQLGLLFWVLIGLLPIFVWLVIVSITNHNMYPPVAIVQAWYYLAYFAFFYGVLVVNTFSEKVVASIYITLLITYLLYIIGIIEFTRIVVGFTFLFSSTLALFLVGKTKKLIVFSIALFAFFSALFIKDETTLTMLAVSVLSLMVALLYFKGKTNFIQYATGILPFILIIVIYSYGINNYLHAEELSTPVKSSISDWQTFGSWVRWKFYFDRAPFWAGGFHQIMDLKHFFPIPDMPDLTAVYGRRAEREITFGSHTTMIELVRMYGLIAGFLLNVCLVYIVIISRKVLLLPEIRTYSVPLFSMAIVATIVLTLAGQYQVLPGYAILSLGVLGIAYGTYYGYEFKTN